jgi:hypothetical protein
LHDDVFCLWGDRASLGILYRRVEDKLIHRLQVIMIERRAADHHFVQQNAEAPPIH